MVFVIDAGPIALGRVLKEESKQQEWLKILAKNNNKNVSTASDLQQKALFPPVYFIIELMNGF